jgi:heme exporter protein C
VLTTAFALVFFYAPVDADQGIVQKIFYVHVPMAIVALCGFVAGGVFAIQHLRTGDRRWDMRSYVTIHWWVWDEPMLVVFLIVFLLYATYQPLRFSIEDHEKQSRYASVFAITAGAFVPLCFGAVRKAQDLTHPQAGTMTTHGPSSVTITFLVSLLGMSLLFATLCKYEMASKNATSKLRHLHRRLAGDDDFGAAAPARSAAPQL